MLPLAVPCSGEDMGVPSSSSSADGGINAWRGLLWMLSSHNPKENLIYTVTTVTESGELQDKPDQTQLMPLSTQLPAQGEDFFLADLRFRSNMV